MNKQFLMLPLLLTGATVRSADKEPTKVEKNNPFDDLFGQVRQDMQRLENNFKAVQQYMFSGFDQLRDEIEKNKNNNDQKIALEASQDDNFVYVKMRLGDLKVQDINVEAENDSLEGKVPLKNGSASFYVRDGFFFGLTVHREATSKGTDKGKDFVMQSSEATETLTLPAYVENLSQEDKTRPGAEVSYEKGVLTIKMPKVPVKKGTKINVIAK